MSFSHSFLSWLLLAFSILLPPNAASGEEPATSMDERQQIKQLQHELRQTKDDLDAKSAVIDKAEALSYEAVLAVHETLQEELGRDLKEYVGGIHKTAAAKIDWNLRQVNPQEIVKKRREFLDLVKKGDLTKDDIERAERNDMARIRMILTTDLQTVISSSQSLGEAREALVGKGRLWDRTAKYVFENAPPEAEGADDEGEEQPAVERRPPGKFEEIIAKQEASAVAGSMRISDGSRRVMAANASIAAKMDPQEAAAIRALNIDRALLGLPALQIDPRLVMTGRMHSKDMAERGFFDHKSPVEGRESFTDRAKLCGTTASGENIFMGNESGEAAHKGWFHSPGHFKNQMGNHRRVGVGRYEQHFTQVFGR